jgi:hypothetical protein
MKKLIALTAALLLSGAVLADDVVKKDGVLVNAPA